MKKQNDKQEAFEVLIAATCAAAFLASMLLMMGVL